MINEKDHLLDEGLQALEEADWIVSKIGGLNACDFQENFKRINQKRSAGKKQVVVLSVPRTKDFNTTTHINKFVKTLRNEGKDAARPILEEIDRQLSEIITSNVEPEHQTSLLKILERYMGQLYGYLETGLHHNFEIKGKDLRTNNGGEIQTITGWGEDLAEDLYKTYFREKGTSAGEIKINRQEIYENPDLLRDRYHSAVEKVLGEDLILTGGYEAYLGETRGYSDPKAALITASLAHHGENVVLGIEKQQGISSADPSIIPDAHPIYRMSSKFAAEVFGIFGGEAGALHHLVVPILNGSSAKIVVFNPADPSARTTCIYRDAVMEPTTVVARKFVPTIRVYGPMSNEKGIAEKVMRALKEHSLDQIYTAENEVRVTLSSSGEIEDIKFDDAQIGTGYSHSIDAKQVIVCISTHDEILRGGGVLKDNRIKVESSSFVGEVGNDPYVNVSTYVVKPDDSTRSLEHLHNAFAYAA